MRPSAHFTPLPVAAAPSGSDSAAAASGERRDVTQIRVLNALAIAACVVALATALYHVRGLAWPYADDNFRDIAQAQTALDGHPFHDPYYVGERVWYNPLVPWVIASGSWLTGIEPTRLHVHAGPWLNLIGPIAFWALAVRLFGRGPGLVALLVFLFVNGPTGPSRDNATYGPWLFGATLGQGLFYLAVLALHIAGEQRSHRSAALAGCLAGVTLLCHTAPATILACIALATLRPRALVTWGAAALLISSPFLYVVAVHYGGHVRNYAPAAGGPWLTASVVRFPELVAANAFLLVTATAGVVLRRHRLLGTWLGVSLALLAYGLWCDLNPTLPRLVPNLHFWRYASAAMTIYAGVAIWWLLTSLTTTRLTAITALASVASVGLLYPRYLERPDWWGRATAQRRSPDLARLTRELRTTTDPGTVVLASAPLSLEVAGPAGRQVIALDPLFSNPYVDVGSRTADRDAMFAALDDGEAPHFRALARRHGVTAVIGSTDAQCHQWDRTPLVLARRIGQTCLFRVDP
jgi:hypothetical protein